MIGASLLFTAKSLWGTQTLGPCAGVQEFNRPLCKQRQTVVLATRRLRVAGAEVQLGLFCCLGSSRFINREECLPAKLSSWQDGKGREEDSSFLFCSSCLGSPSPKAVLENLALSNLESWVFRGGRDSGSSSPTPDHMVSRKKVGSHFPMY